jgi:hypothetical protein
MPFTGTSSAVFPGTSSRYSHTDEIRKLWLHATDGPMRFRAHWKRENACISCAYLTCTCGSQDSSAPSLGVVTKP